MKRCKIPTGCNLPDHPCCADCGDKTCTARCWNSPERCGLWTDSPPRRPRKSKINAQVLLRLHEQDLPQREIARRLGCSVSAVSAALRKLGVKRYE